jgi:hypothetical protein
MNDRRITLRFPAVCIPILLHVVLWLSLWPYHVHPTTSVEADFPRYLAQAVIEFDDVAWDGFAPCGYPFLLRIGRWVSGDAFRSGLVLSGLAGVWFLAAAFGLARRVLSTRAATFVTSLIALNWLFVHNSQLAATDLLWSAAVLTGLHTAIAARRRNSLPLHALSGGVLGLSYLFRYATLAVAPALLLLLLVDARGTRICRRIGVGFAFVAGFVLLALPQLFLATRATGNPFASQQAKNVWFGMFGERDWVRNWGEVESDVSLLAVVTEHPGAFAKNVARNLGEFAVMSLTWPLGYSPRVFKSDRLAIILLVLFAGTILIAGRSAGNGRRLRELLGSAVRNRDFRLCAGVSLLYAVAVSMAFWMARFYLPLLALLTIGLAVVVRRIFWPALRARPVAPALLLIILPVFFLTHSVSAYARFLEAGQQPIGDVKVAMLVAGLDEDSIVVTTNRQHYSTVLPWTFVPVPPAVRDFDDLQQFLAEVDADCFLIEERYDPEGRSYYPALDVLLIDPYACPFLEWFYWREASPRVVLFHAR